MRDIVFPLTFCVVYVWLFGKPVRYGRWKFTYDDDDDRSFGIICNLKDPNRWIIKIPNAQRLVCTVWYRNSGTLFLLYTLYSFCLKWFEQVWITIRINSWMSFHLLLKVLHIENIEELQRVNYVRSFQWSRTDRLFVPIRKKENRKCLIFTILHAFLKNACTTSPKYCTFARLPFHILNGIRLMFDQ